MLGIKRLVPVTTFLLWIGKGFVQLASAPVWDRQAWGRLSGAHPNSASTGQSHQHSGPCILSPELTLERPGGAKGLERS